MKIQDYIIVKSYRVAKRDGIETETIVDIAKKDRWQKRDANGQTSLFTM